MEYRNAIEDAVKKDLKRIKNHGVHCRWLKLNYKKRSR